MSEAGQIMVVDHPDGLHEGVGNRRTDKTKSIFFAFLSQRF
jgi:hypothetical protein